MLGTSESMVEAGCNTVLEDEIDSNKRIGTSNPGSKTFVEKMDSPFVSDSKSLKMEVDDEANEVASPGNSAVGLTTPRTRRLVRQNNVGSDHVDILFSIRGSKITMNEKKIDLTRLYNVMKDVVSFMNDLQSRTAEQPMPSPLKYQSMIAAFIQESSLEQPTMIVESIFKSILSYSGIFDEQDDENLLLLRKYHTNSILEFIKENATLIDYGRKETTIKSKKNKNNINNKDDDEDESNNRVSVPIYRWELNSLEAFFDKDIVNILSLRRVRREKACNDINSISSSSGNLTQILQKQLIQKKEDLILKEKKRLREETISKKQKEKEERQRIKEEKQRQKEQERIDRQKKKEQERLLAEQERIERQKKKEQERLLAEQEEIKKKKLLKDVKESDNKKKNDGQQQILGFFTPIQKKKENKDLNSLKNKRSDWFLPFHIRKGVTVAPINRFHPELAKIQSIRNILDNYDENLLPINIKNDYDSQLEKSLKDIYIELPKPEEDFEKLRKNVLLQFKKNGNQYRLNEREQEIKKIKKFLDADNESNDDNNNNNNKNSSNSSPIKNNKTNKIDREIIDLCDGDMEMEMDFIEPEFTMNDENDSENNKNNDNVVESTYPIQTLLDKKYKFIKFYENFRPAYWGTWTKPRTKVNGRNPFAKEDILDYNLESDLEWVEEEEPGKDLNSDDEDDEDDGMDNQSMTSDMNEMDDWLIPQDEENDEGNDDEDDDDDDDDGDDADSENENIPKNKKIKTSSSNSQVSLNNDAPRWGIRKRLVPIIMGPQNFNNGVLSKSIYPSITGSSLILDIKALEKTTNLNELEIENKPYPKLLLQNLDPTIDYHNEIYQFLLNRSSLQRKKMDIK